MATNMICSTIVWAQMLGKPRGPKSLNFPEGNFQPAKTFQTKCVNLFRDKKSVRKFFFDKKMNKYFFATKKCV